jgi:hypothetical protein
LMGGATKYLTSLPSLPFSYLLQHVNLFWPNEPVKMGM